MPRTDRRSGHRREGEPQPRQGQPFRVSLLLNRPGRDMVVSRNGTKDQGHADVYVALRDSFDAAERQMDETGR